MKKGSLMKDNRRVKLLSMLLGMFLSGGAMHAYALGNALTGQANLTAGANEWANNCARCHNLRSSSEFSANHWQAIMMHMRIQAGITGQEARNIYAFISGQSATTQATNAAASTAIASTTATNNTEVNPEAIKAGLKQKLALNNPSAATNQAQTTAQASSGLSGAAVYQQTCVACHGANGKGAIPGAPDFTSASGPLTNSDAVLLQRIISGYQSPGSPMAMPPRGGNPKLTDGDLKNALSYIRSKFGK
jgi:mono/diheme cytochrome c family protein